MLRKILCFWAAPTEGAAAIPRAATPAVSAPARSHRYPAIIISSLFHPLPQLTGVYLVIIDHDGWSTSRTICGSVRQQAREETARQDRGTCADDGRGAEETGTASHAPGA